MKIISKAYLMILISLLITSCECGQSVNLGDLPLDKQSLDYQIYSGSEVLVFTDQHGNEHFLTSKNGLVYDKISLHGEEECRHSPFDFKDKYYITDFYETAFFEGDNQIFYTELRPNNAAETVEDNFLLFDNFSLYFDYDTINISINLIVSDRGNSIPDTYKEAFNNELIFIGDTILYDKHFQNVSYVKNNYGFNTSSILFFNFQEGILAVKFDQDKYWVLDRVE